MPVVNRVPLRCIGGPKDGDVLLLPEGQGYVTVREPNPPPVLREPDYSVDSVIDAKDYQYRVELIHAGNATYRVLVEQALTVGDALTRLVLNYNPKVR